MNTKQCPRYRRDNFLVVEIKNCLTFSVTSTPLPAELLLLVLSFGGSLAVVAIGEGSSAVLIL